MRRRFIITTSLAVILFAMCLFGINVYASMNQSFSISNKIKFISDESICLSLECEVSGCKQSTYTKVPEGYRCNSLEEYWEEIGIIHNEEFDESQRDSQNLNNSKWEIKESLEFIDSKTEIVYTIKVTNYSFVPVKVSFSDYVKNSNVIENTVSEEQILGEYVPNKEPKSATMELKTSVKNSGKSFEVENKFSILIEKYTEV